MRDKKIKQPAPAAIETDTPDATDKELDNIHIEPKKRHRKTKKKIRISNPLEVLKECSESPVTAALDDYLCRITNEKLKVNIKPDDVKVFAAIHYAFKYYDVELPLDHPLAVFAYANANFAYQIFKQKIGDKKNETA